MLVFLKLIFLFGLAAFIIMWHFKRSNDPVVTAPPQDEW
jgi:hypothetical protein